jgi:signal transduction histidine kinase
VRGLLKQNEELSRSLQELAKSNEVVKEQILQRTGADLHDGPAQLLAFAMLRMSRLAKIAADTKDEKAVADVKQVQTAVSDALREVRNTSAMLSLPSLERVDLAEIVRIVVTRHQEHTDSKVQVSLESVPEHVPQSLKICIYRFVQEALSNAFRHGKGVGQHVAVRGGERLEVIVSDEGEGFDPDKLNGIGLGVSGMRARVRALGGALDVKSEPGSGTVLAAIFGKEALAGEEQTVGAAA